MLSVIVPVYNEEDNIECFLKALNETLTELPMEWNVYFVDDGSTDNSWAVIQSMMADDSRINGIQLSRNFGKEAALYCGLDNATGDCCVCMDCDLQHPPEKIIEMYRLWESGYEVVTGVKQSRGKESRLHSWASRLFYAIMSRSMGKNMQQTSDFKLLDRKVVDALLCFGESNTFFRALSSWIGFKQTQITYEVGERANGASKWSLPSLMRYAVMNITSFTSFPIQLMTWLGVLMCVVAVVLSIVSLVKYFLGVALGGFTTVILIQLFSSSLIMISLGVSGYYIVRIFREVLNRPRYIIARSVHTQRQTDGNAGEPPVIQQAQHTPSVKETPSI